MLFWTTLVKNLNRKHHLFQDCKGIGRLKNICFHSVLDTCHLSQRSPLTVLSEAAHPHLLLTPQYSFIVLFIADCCLTRLSVCPPGMGAACGCWLFCLPTYISPWLLIAAQSVFVDPWSPSFHESLTRLLESNKGVLTYLNQEIWTFFVKKVMLLPVGIRSTVLVFWLTKSSYLVLILFTFSKNFPSFLIFHKHLK